MNQAMPLEQQTAAEREVALPGARARQYWHYLILLLLVLPSLYWIGRDRSVWPWDPAFYAEVTTGLWFILSHRPSHWIRVLLSAFGFKAPGIAWIGQFFVPLGELAGSVEVGLLLSILACQTGTLVLVYRTGRELVQDKELPPLLGAIVVGAAPLFIGMSHQYFAEPLQLFGVAYIYWIAARAPTGMARTPSHLLLAASLALLGKASSPIYCLLPGGIAILDAWHNHRAPERRPYRFEDWLLLTTAITVAAATAAWYWRNYGTYHDFVNQSASGKVALDYGHVDSFTHKLTYWLAALQKSVALPEVLLLAGALAAVAVTARLLRRRSRGTFFKSPGLAGARIRGPCRSGLALVLRQYQ